jgi:hypothetical protein
MGNHQAMITSDTGKKQAGGKRIEQDSLKP